MRRTWFLTCLWLMLAWPIAADAQPAPAPETDAEVGAEETTEAADSEPADAPQSPPGEPTVADEPASEEASAELAAEDGDQASPSLQPPELEPLNVPPPPELEPEPEPELPDPAEAAELLDDSEPAEAPAEKSRWTLPRPVFSLHGYFRVRANLMRHLALGRPPDADRLQNPAGTRTNIDPFYAYRPRDSTPNPDSPTGATVVGGCGKSAGADGTCSRDLQVGTDMRLRLKPEIALGEDVRLKMWIDVLDNVVFGSINRNPNDNLDLKDTVQVRRAWGEVGDRDLGELRFGRMGADWGLGILDNGGDRNGIDSDFSSDVDRMMGITNLGGFYLMGAYDWAAQGDFLAGSSSPSGVPIDEAQKDDLNEITLAAALRDSPEKEEAALARGDAVFNIGTYFIWRKQLIENNPEYDGTNNGVPPYQRLDEKQYIPDLWMRLQWQGLRLELESVFVAGTIEGGCPRLEGPPTSGTEEPPPGTGKCKLREFGTALEAEYRLIDDRLGIYFYSGFATGDKNAYGLAQTNNPSQQRVKNDNTDPSKSGYNDTISTYAFHPDYRIDLILWRSIMRRVAGAYYFKPGVSFDFLRNPFGRRLGGEFNVIYSRASHKAQTWGRNSNMGVEMDLSLYYRSEDGPDPLDGFYGLLEGAVLFPLKGLQYKNDEDAYAGGDVAIMFRTVLGIAF